jgi:hypothetical protein
MDRQSHKRRDIVNDPLPPSVSQKFSFFADAH